MDTQFAFSVFVNGKPLKEYELDDDTYIEADLHTDTSYIIKDVDDEGYTQNYPVTPFEVQGWFRNTLKIPCYLKLCVDGQQIWMKPFPPSYDIYDKHHFKVSGIKDMKQGSLKELLFSLPKLTSQKDQSSENWTKHLGSITMECLEAVENGYFQTRRREFRQVQQPTILSDKTTHYQATKQDCSRKGGIGVATREGRGISTFGLTSNVITMMRYKLGHRSFGKLIVKYRTRYVLEELGIIDKKWVNADSDISTQHKNNKITSTEKHKEKSHAQQKNTEVKISEKENSAPVVNKATSEIDNTTKLANASMDDIGKNNSNGENILAEQDIKKTIKKEMIDDESEEKDGETECIKYRLRSSKKVDNSAIQTEAIKKEKNTAEDKYQQRVDSVISQLRDLECSDSKKLFCYSPSSLKIKKEVMDNGKLGCHSQSDVSQSLFNGKLGCHSPSDKSIDKLIDSRQIKKEVVDNEDKQFRYIEIDDDLIMLEEVDDEVLWMGDDSCCFIDIEPENVPVIDIA